MRCVKACMLNPPCVFASPCAQSQRTVQHCSSCLRSSPPRDLTARRAHSEPGWPSVRRSSRCLRLSVVCCYLQISTGMRKPDRAGRGGKDKWNTKQEREETKGERNRHSFGEQQNVWANWTCDIRWLQCNHWPWALVLMVGDKHEKSEWLSIRCHVGRWLMSFLQSRFTCKEKSKWN